MGQTAAHYNAFRDRLRAHAALADKVDTTVRISSESKPVRANYVVAFPGIPLRLDDDRYMAGQSVDSKADIEYDTRVVATTADGLLLLVDAVLEQCIGHRLIVPGRKCTAMKLTPESDEMAKFDRSADLHFQNLTFGFTSQRST